METAIRFTIGLVSELLLCFVGILIFPDLAKLGGMFGFACGVVTMLLALNVGRK